MTDPGTLWGSFVGAMLSGCVLFSLGWSIGLRQGRYYGIKQARASEQRRPIKRRLRGLQEHFKRFLTAKEKIQKPD